MIGTKRPDHWYAKIERNMPKAMPLGLCLLLATGGIANTQTMVPTDKGSCPSGSTHAGSGYCKSRDGSNFVIANNGSCPSGSVHAGAGYCRSNPGDTFVLANKGSCPSGSVHAGAGYCRVR